MAGGAQLSITEMRRGSRFPVQLNTVGEHRRDGEVALRITNISPTGFMVGGTTTLGRGERLTIRLPVVGGIEAFLVWADEGRAGFQFERIIRADEFARMVRQLHTPLRQPLIRTRT